MWMWATSFILSAAMHDTRDVHRALTTSYPFENYLHMLGSTTFSHDK